MRAPPSCCAWTVLPLLLGAYCGKDAIADGLSAGDMIREVAALAGGKEAVVRNMPAVPLRRMPILRPWLPPPAILLTDKPLYLGPIGHQSWIRRFSRTNLRFPFCLICLRQGTWCAVFFAILTIFEGINQADSDAVAAFSYYQNATF